MVTLATFVPNAQSIEALSKLRGGVRVLQPLNTLGGLTRLYLADGDVLVDLSVDYQDAAFKFECFNLVIKKVSSGSFANNRDIARFSGDVVECIFRFEWERPARSGEVPLDWEQTVREYGAREKIPNDASAVCVSMIGIGFRNSSQDIPIAVIVSDDDNIPGTVRICERLDEIELAISGTERVNANEAQKWILELQQLRQKLRR